MFPESELPQVLGSEVMQLILILSKMSPELVYHCDKFRIGFNSLGAAATVNHLHLHLIYPKDAIGVQQLPIQAALRKQICKSSLINPKEEINMIL